MKEILPGVHHRSTIHPVVHQRVHSYSITATGTRS